VATQLERVSWFVQPNSYFLKIIIIVAGLNHQLILIVKRIIPSMCTPKKSMVKVLSPFLFSFLLKHNKHTQPDKPSLAPK
jgi:hypothetical protein